MEAVIYRVMQRYEGGLLQPLPKGTRTLSFLEIGNLQVNKLFPVGSAYESLYYIEI